MPSCQDQQAPHSAPSHWARSHSGRNEARRPDSQCKQLQVLKQVLHFEQYEAWLKYIEDQVEIGQSVKCSTSCREQLARNVQHHAITLGASLLLLIASPQLASAGPSSNARQTSGQVRQQKRWCLYVFKKHACWVFIQGDQLDQLLEQNAHSGIKAQGPAAQKRFQVVRSSVLHVPM